MCRYRLVLSLALFATVALGFTGCSWVKVTDVPNPFSENLVFGKVIKEIRIEGAEHTRGSVFRLTMASKVGEVYTEEKARLDSKWLIQLGIFTAVKFDTIDELDGVVLVVSVAEVNPYIPAPSIKITEENGLEIGVALSSPNLFGIASRISTWIRFGGATNIGIRYKDPWYPGSHPWNGFQLDYFHMERRNKVWEFDESSDDFTLIYAPNLNNNLKLGPRISYLGVKSDQSGITLDPDNRDNIPGVGLSFQLDTRNLQNYPTSGWWGEILISKFGLFDTESDYWQGNLDVRRYFQVEGARQSIAVYSLTTLTTGEVGVDIPVYMQFVLGGTNTVRGWELGAREGKNQFINTVEYWYSFGKLRQYEVWFLKQALGFQAAAFADVGTAWTNGDEFHQNWIGGGGIGLRLIVPSMVMVRFDLAYGQSGADIGIYIGSQEKATLQRDRVR